MPKSELINEVPTPFLLPQAIREAQSLAKSGDYSAAAKRYALITDYLDHQVDCDLRYLGAYLEAGNLCLKQDLPEQALVLYRTYLKHAPQSNKRGYVYTQMAAAALQIADQQRALDYYQQALESGLSGNAAGQAHYRRARLLQSRNQNRAALQAYQFAVTELTSPALRSRAYAALGKLWQSQKNWQEAASAYEQAIDLSQPAQIADRCFQLGVIYTQLQRFAEAEQMLDQALAAYTELDQVFWQAMSWLKKSILALIQKQLEQVIVCAESAIAVLAEQQEPSVLITAYDLIGEVYAYQQRHLEAESWFARSRELKASLNPHFV